MNFLSLGVVVFLAAGPAAAAVGASVSVSNDERLRGHSISGRKPFASLDLTYDDASGIYIGTSASSLFSSSSAIVPLSGTADIGFARPIGASVTIDVGALDAIYSHYASNGHQQYAEFYSGIITKFFSTHFYYSPNYLRAGIATVYGEVDAATRLASDWRVNAHVGVLAEVSSPAKRETRYDWRVGLTRQFNRFELQLSQTGGGPDRDFFSRGLHDRSATVVGVTIVF